MIMIKVGGFGDSPAEFSCQLFLLPTVWLHAGAKRKKKKNHDPFRSKVNLQVSKQSSTARGRLLKVQYSSSVDGAKKAGNGDTPGRVG